MYKFIIRTLCLLIVVSGFCFSSDAKGADLRDAVVKIYTTSNRVDFYHPWQTKGSKPSIGSGGVISGNRILTNAHVVSDHTFIQVKKHSDPKKYTAKLIAIAHDCDLAILSVEDEDFFKGVPTLEIGDLPKLQDTVNVVGYPTGGDKISITEGVISRVEVTTYSHSLRRLLTVQIDAAINPGNSGGPVIQDGKMVGVAMQVASNTQNIGYVIPPPIIKHFLEDLKDGQYDGFPTLGMEFNGTENSAIKKYYKFPKNAEGVLVTHIFPFSAAFKILKEGDVLLEINKTPVSEDGTYLFRESERLFFSHLITNRQMGESLNLLIFRDGKKRNIKMKLIPFEPLVFPPYAYRNPPYYIFGGLIFTVLTTDLLKEWGPKWWEGPIEFNHYRVGSGRLNKKVRKEVVILLGVLPDDINVGYHDYTNFVVSRLNGRDVVSFKDFVLELNKKQGAYTVIESEQKVQIILNNSKIEQADAKILKRNNIPTQNSSEVEKWLSGK